VYDSEVDLSLEVEQGLCNTVDKLLMIIHEFCNIYLECKHTPNSHACTVSSVAQLLCNLHRVMERREIEAVAESVSHHTAILTVLGSAVSKHRECKLLVLSPGNARYVSWIYLYTLIQHGYTSSMAFHTRNAIESLLIMWTDCSKVISQAMTGVGVLKAIADTLYCMGY